jgi:DNA polymerase I
MEQYLINSKEEFSNLQEYIKQSSLPTPEVSIKNGCYLIQYKTEAFNIDMNQFSKEDRQLIFNYIKELETPKPIEKIDSLIFGKDNTQNIVSCEVKDDEVELFIEKDGAVTSKFIENKFWILSSKKHDANWVKLNGNLYYKYIKYYFDRKSFYLDKQKYKDSIYSINDAKESAMILNGFTYYKGMKVSDVSIFHFDLETSGLVHDKNSKIYLISTTYKNKGLVKKKLFSCDEFESDADMLIAFCDYMKECNPSVVAGFNIFGFDLPYIKHCADLLDINLSMGRDDSNIKFDKYVSKFRKDGSQDYEYTRCWIYGREIVDVMFVAYHFDFARKYESYGLKKIIAQEGLEKPGRVYYDASQISKNWNNLTERAKIKQYCIDDSDDSDTLYQLMIPSYFYLTPSIPKSFQAVNFSASGAQINSLLVRSYLQDNHSIPEVSEVVRYAGAISDGNPGIYSNVFKVDVASLYPSIILQYEVYDKVKDPSGHFLKMVRYFTKERLNNKRIAKETGDRYYKDLEQSEKIIINSAYGLLGMYANFNSPRNAAMVTEYGRDILKKAILWASGKEYVEKSQEDPMEE